MVSEAWVLWRWGLLGALLLAASGLDRRTGECPDCIHLMVLLAGLSGVVPQAVPRMLLEGLVPGVLTLLVGLFAKGRLGGADIKLSAACGFFMGAGKALSGLMIGSLLALLCESIKGNHKGGFPFIPYLSAGFMAAGLFL